MSQPKHLVRTRDLAWSEAAAFKHPLNPNSQMHAFSLSAMAGMQRVHLHLIRIPPGKENYVPHAHAIQEEFVFVLEGSATATLGDQQVQIGPGDYLGFPTDGLVHHIVNTGPGDFTYLTGGERTDVEVSDFPSLGKVAVSQGGDIRLFGKDGVETITRAEWMARSRLPES